MALGRVKTWNPGDILTASDLNGEFNNILNNPISLVSPTTGAINFNLQAHTGLLPSVITGTSGSNNQILFTSGGAGAAANWKSLSGLSGDLNNFIGLNGTISTAAAATNATFSFDRAVFISTDYSIAFVCSATSAFVINCQTVGPSSGGKDQAGAFQSTDVHFYAITTGAGSTAPQGICSSQPPAVGPTLPSSYSALAYLGACKYSTLSSVPAFAMTMEQNTWSYNQRQLLLNSAFSSAEATVSGVTFIPQNARMWSGSYFQSNSASTGINAFINTEFHLNTGTTYIVFQTALISANGTASGGWFTIPNVSQQFFYLINTSATGPALTVLIPSYSF